VANAAATPAEAAEFLGLLRLRPASKTPTPVINNTWRRDYPKVAQEVIGSPVTVEAAAEYVTGLITQVDAARP
jgi:hypothetical protein